ncbi:hypothetical protein CB1_000274018 [Camelus ferus]|nr:hypothetical protein CB1_000274018 [Camelus ferus]
MPCNGLSVLCQAGDAPSSKTKHDLPVSSVAWSNSRIKELARPGQNGIASLSSITMHSHQPVMQMAIGAPGPRTAVQLTSAASAITPPNVSAANLSGEVGGGPISGPSTPSPTSTGGRPDERRNEKTPLSMAVRPEPRPLPRERYRVVVSYPPQSEAEIELKEGDVVFVHKKREDGWYKGTLQRNGRTGLFPGSFVESF